MLCASRNLAWSPLFRSIRLNADCNCLYGIFLYGTKRFFTFFLYADCNSHCVWNFSSLEVNIWSSRLNVLVRMFQYMNAKNIVMTCAFGETLIIKLSTLHGNARRKGYAPASGVGEEKSSVGGICFSRTMRQV